MLRFWRWIGFVMLIAAVIISVNPASATTPPFRVKGRLEAVDATKLNYLFFTNDSRLNAARQGLFKELQLQPNEQKAFLAIIDTQRQSLDTLYRETSPVVRNKAMSITAKQDAITSLRYNDRVERTAVQTDNAIRTLLAGRYQSFETWMKSWWQREREFWQQKQKAKGPVIQANVSVCYMYATQYNGYSSYEVALPDKYVKFANLGWYYRQNYTSPPYTVNIWRGSRSVNGVTVRDVGPWNEDDNYWDSASGANPRRLFSNLRPCYSEAEEAYFNGYNGGRDQFGRRVTNPAGIDLTPRVAADLGLGYLQNAWVYVRYDDLP